MHAGNSVGIDVGILSRAEARFQNLQEIWGTPFYQNSNVLLYHGDCLEFLRKVPPDFFDLTVTSPPYNIGKEYENVRPLEDYLGWCSEWMTEIYRATTPEGTFWLNLGYVAVPERGTAVPLPYLLWNRSPFHFLQEVVWNYGAGVACKRMYSPRNEKFLWYVKDADRYTFNLDEVRDPDVKYPNQKKNGRLRCNPLGKNPSDVWSIPKVTSGTDRSSKERTPHPAQFPCAVIDRLIKASSNAGDIIFDPFLGSGTTAEAAFRNRRFVVGIELDERYLGYAAQRLSDCALQSRSGLQTSFLDEIAADTATDGV
jgi:adenine-specific DNA-methyltransferase